MRKIAASLATRSDKLIQVDETTLNQKLGPIYTVLTKQAHGEGLDIYDLQEDRDNVTRYLAKSFNLWYSKVLESFDTADTTSILYQIVCLSSIIWQPMFYFSREIIRPHNCRPRVGNASH